MTAPGQPRRPGAPLKDPKAGRRVPINVRVKPNSRDLLKGAAKRWGMSQGDVLDLAIERLPDMFR